MRTTKVPSVTKMSYASAEVVEMLIALIKCWFTESTSRRQVRTQGTARKSKSSCKASEQFKTIHTTFNVKNDEIQATTRGAGIQLVQRFDCVLRHGSNAPPFHIWEHQIPIRSGNASSGDVNMFRIARRVPRHQSIWPAIHVHFQAKSYRNELVVSHSIDNMCLTVPSSRPALLRPSSRLSTISFLCGFLDAVSKYGLKCRTNWRVARVSHLHVDFAMA